MGLMGIPGEGGGDSHWWRPRRLIQPAMNRGRVQLNDLPMVRCEVPAGDLKTPGHLKTASVCAGACLEECHLSYYSKTALRPGREQYASGS